MIYYDTHVLVWIFFGKHDCFSKLAIEFIENRRAVTGSINILELGYLYDIGRIKVDALEIYNTLAINIGLKIHEYGDKAALKALDIKWTHDPFDRLTVAGSSILNIPLLTKDELIHKNFNQAVW